MFDNNLDITLVSSLSRAQSYMNGIYTTITSVNKYLETNREQPLYRGNTIAMFGKEWGVTVCCYIVLMLGRLEMSRYRYWMTGKKLISF